MIFLVQFVLTIGVIGLLSCRLAVSNWEPAARSEMSHEYSSSYFTAPLNSFGKTWNIYRYAMKRWKKLRHLNASKTKDPLPWYPVCWYHLQMPQGTERSRIWAEHLNLQKITDDRLSWSIEINTSTVPFWKYIFPWGYLLNSVLTSSPPLLWSCSKVGDCCACHHREQNLVQWTVGLEGCTAPIWTIQES